MLYREYNLSTYITDEGNYDNLPNEFYEGLIETKLKINYPLSNPSVKKIRFSCLYELIDEIRRVYREIYERDEKLGTYGIHLHGIEDLVIERIYIDEDVVSLYIGS